MKDIDRPPFKRALRIRSPAHSRATLKPDIQAVLWFLAQTHSTDVLQKHGCIMVSIQPLDGSLVLTVIFALGARARGLTELHLADWDRLNSVYDM